MSCISILKLTEPRKCILFIWCENICSCQYTEFYYPRKKSKSVTEKKSIKNSKYVLFSKMATTKFEAVQMLMIQFCIAHKDHETNNNLKKIYRKEIQ